MKSELILLCHAATRAMKTGLFPTTDDPLDETERPRISRLGELFSVDRIATSPARAARYTQAIIGSPAISRKTLRGRRVEPRRAGITPRMCPSSEGKNGNLAD